MPSIPRVVPRGRPPPAPTTALDMSLVFHAGEPFLQLVRRGSFHGLDLVLAMLGTDNVVRAEKVLAVAEKIGWLERGIFDPRREQRFFGVGGQPGDRLTPGTSLTLYHWISKVWPPFEPRPRVRVVVLRPLETLVRAAWLSKDVFNSDQWPALRKKLRQLEAGEYKRVGPRTLEGPSGLRYTVLSCGCVQAHRKDRQGSQIKACGKGGTHGGKVRGNVESYWSIFKREAVTG